MSKVFVLGVEGLDYNLIQEWKDELPNIVRVGQKYISGKIKSKVNPNRAMEWTTIYTGQNPGATGIWDSWYRDSNSYGSYCYLDPGIIMSAGLSTMLPRTGKILALVNYPYTEKKQEIVTGYFIPEKISSRDVEGSIYPPGLSGDDTFKALLDKYLEAREDNGSLDKVIAAEDSLLEVSKYFMKANKYWDCIFTVLGGIRNNCLVNNAKDLKSYYTYLDKKIRDISDAIGDEAYLMVVSPYSLKRPAGILNISRWLVDNGYLFLDSASGDIKGIDPDQIDWKKTIAWPAKDGSQIYLNLQGREEQGSVSGLEEYNRLAQDITGKLEKLSDSKGRSLGLKVLRRHGLFYGPRQDLGPDLFIDSSASLYKIASGSPGPDLMDGASDDDMFLDGSTGFIGLYGPHIKSGDTDLEITSSSVTPTIIDILRDESHFTDIYISSGALELTETIKDILSYPLKDKMKRSFLREYIVEEVKKETSEEEMVASRLEFMGY